jgi:hypothetical protein
MFYKNGTFAGISAAPVQVRQRSGKMELKYGDSTVVTWKGYEYGKL